MVSTPEEQSFENIVLSFYEDLLEIHRTSSYPSSMNQFRRGKLRRDGIVDVEKGQSRDRVILTDNACNLLRKYKIL